jgi:predicted metal-binding membrane protein
MQGPPPLLSASPPGMLGRWLFWLGFYAAVLLGWAFLMRMTASPMPGLSAAEYWAALCISAGNADPLALFAMWVLMSAAMMLPTFVPALRVFGELGSVRATDGRSMAALVLGYGMVWLAFSAFAAVLQLGLAQAGAMAEAGPGLSPWVSAALLAAAGAYQFSGAKEACLAKCRHPLMFFMEHWAPGVRPAFAMGARLGVWCVGCCWLLMLLGLVGGAMNLLWMGAATLFMVLEKLPEIGRYLTRPLGAALLVAAVAQIVTAYSSGG